MQGEDAAILSPLKRARADQRRQLEDTLRARLHFDWLVPGLRAARIEGLIRTLPNHLRRYCTPAADYATAVSARLETTEGRMLDRVCEALRAMSGLDLKPTDFQPHKLDAHLKPRLQLENDRGEILGAGERLSDLQSRFAGAARSALNQAATQNETLLRWTRDRLTDWDFDTLPDQVGLAGGARAHPALTQIDGGIGLRLFESPTAAESAHAIGTRALLLGRMADRLRDLTKSVRLKLALLAPGFALDPEAIARSIAARAADAVLLRDGAIRTREAFQAALERRGEFSIDAQRRLDDIANWLTQARELRARLTSLKARWPLSIADLQQQLDTLFAPGFVEAIPEAQWRRIVLYLRALSIRMERLANKPVRDEDLTRQVAPLVARLPGPFHDARWLLEEWRITLCAQELKAVGSPTAARIEAALKP